jgi:hypothetical protein
MKKPTLALLAALALGGVTTGALIAQAQPAPPPGPAAGVDGPPRHHMRDWMRHGHGDRGDRGMEPGTFSLFYRQSDRQLSAADVQKIAEAFLLWQGNRTWKVTNVAPAGDNAIGFSIATPDGTVIAKFTMDPHTGRVTRTG